MLKAIFTEINIAADGSATAFERTDIAGGESSTVNRTPEESSAAWQGDGSTRTFHWTTPPSDRTGLTIRLPDAETASQATVDCAVVTDKNVRLPCLVNKQGSMLSFAGGNGSLEVSLSWPSAVDSSDEAIGSTLSSSQTVNGSVDVPYSRQGALILLAISAAVLIYAIDRRSKQRHRTSRSTRKT